MSVKQLQSAFPDQSQWLSKLAEHVRTSQYTADVKKARRKRGPVTVDMLLQSIDFKLPVELFSMCLCFSGDAQLRQFPVDCSSKDIQNKSEQYAVEHGQWPHLAVALTLTHLSE